MNTPDRSNPLAELRDVVDDLVDVVRDLAYHAPDDAGDMSVTLWNIRGKLWAIDVGNEEDNGDGR